MVPILRSPPQRMPHLASSIRSAAAIGSRAVRPSILTTVAVNAHANKRSHNGDAPHTSRSFQTTHSPLHTVTPVASSSSPATSVPSSSASAAVVGGVVTPSNQSRLDFDDVSESFRVKSNLEIIRSLIVFQLCGLKPLVRHSRHLLQVSERLFGRTVTHFILRQTFFGHFCAGETGQEVQQVIKRLEKSGLGSILDYAAEADISTVPQPRDRTGISSARTYDYEGEAECDANAKICRECIESAGSKGDGNGFAAIKLTALGKPELLEHLAKILIETKKLFLAFANDPTHAKQLGIKNPHPDILVTNKISYEHFRIGLSTIQVHLDEEKMKRLFSLIDKDSSGTIDYLEWISFLDPQLLGGLTPRFRSEGLPTLDQSELEKVQAMMRRIENLAELAAEKKVRLMIDAEQTYFQPAIDHVVLDLQRKYNRTFPVIFNTYQCYLKDSFSRLLLDLERSQREGFIFAAKAVRGAYMIQERRRASEMGYEDPIQPNLQATHDNYHQVVATMLRHPSAHVLVATHNETTVKYVTRLMDELGMPRSGGGVFFGQLLGMCDHVSFSLGHCGYAVYKYVPYGPIHDVIPYLIRRAEENSDMLGGAGKEKKLLARELWRRITGGGGRAASSASATTSNNNQQPDVTKA